MYNILVKSSIVFNASTSIVSYAVATQVNKTSSHGLQGSQCDEADWDRPNYDIT